MKKISLIIVLFTISIRAGYLDRLYYTVNDSVIAVRSGFGLGLNLSLSKVDYDKKTNVWLPDHLAGKFGLDIYFYNLFAHFYFQPMTVNGNDELVYNGNTLHAQSDFNPIKSGILIGYTFSPFKYLWIKPMIGFNHSSITIIEKDKSYQNEFNIPGKNGMTVDIGIAIPIMVKPYEFVNIELGYSKNYTDLTYLNPNFGYRYDSIRFGIIFTGWMAKYVLIKRTNYQNSNVET